MQTLNQKKYSQKYARTQKGKKSHQRRQRRYRLHSKPKNIETQGTSIKSLSRIKVFQTKAELCLICQTFVSPLLEGRHEFALALRRWR